jgi:hypothetical protein
MMITSVAKLAVRSTRLIPPTMIVPSGARQIRARAPLLMSSITAGVCVASATPTRSDRNGTSPRSTTKVHSN